MKNSIPFQPIEAAAADQLSGGLVIWPLVLTGALVDYFSGKKTDTMQSDCAGCGSSGGGGAGGW
jgi:hypothetical protein